MVLSIIFLEDKHKMLLHLLILYEYQQFFQHRKIFIKQLYSEKKTAESANLGHGSL
jgi:hypothetical protein